MPAFWRWSEWIPCGVNSTGCYPTEECRIMYEEIDKPDRPVRDVSQQVLGRGKRDAGFPDWQGTPPHLTGVIYEGYGQEHWGKGKEMYRCQVLRYECRELDVFYWTDWMQGECSSLCSMGYRHEWRYCVNANGTRVYDGYCPGGADATVRYVECNTHLCQNLTEWVGAPESECYPYNNTCYKEYYRECEYVGSVEPDIDPYCLHTYYPCETDSCLTAGYSNWTDWTSCNCSCGPGTQERYAHCLHTQHGNITVDCNGPDYIVETRDCNMDLCLDYSEWEPEGCSVTCGNGTEEWSRFCRVSGGRDPPDNCTEAILPCSEEPCPQCDYVFTGPASECSSSCTNGTKILIGYCVDLGTNDSCTTCMDGNYTTKVMPCNTDLCITYGTWEYSDCSVSCGNGTQDGTRTCVEFDDIPDLPDECVESTLPCFYDPCIEVVGWGDWGPCSSGCSMGRRNRTLECVIEGTTTVVTPEEGCPDDIDVEYCDTHLCGNYTNYTAGDCTYGISTCHSSSVLHTRECIDDGDIPDGCDKFAVPCNTTETKKEIDLRIIYDSTQLMGNCAYRVTISATDPLLADNSTYPEFYQQKVFLNDLYCKWFKIGLDDTRLSLQAHKGACVGSSFITELHDPNPQLSINTLMDFHCESEDFNGNLFCSYSKNRFSNNRGGRGSSGNFVVMILPRIVDSAYASTVAIGGTAARKLLDYKYAFLTSSEDYTSQLTELVQVVCASNNKTPTSGCFTKRFLGSIYEDIDVLIAKMMTSYDAQ